MYIFYSSWQILLKQVKPRWQLKCPTALWKWEQLLSFLSSGLTMIWLAFFCRCTILVHLSVEALCYLGLTSLHLFLFCEHFQIFPMKVDHRWHTSPASQFSLALQQALAKELMMAKQGQVQNGGLAFRLLQAITALLTSAHAGPIVMSMHRSHALSCPLMRQLHLYQVRHVAETLLFYKAFDDCFWLCFFCSSVWCPRTLRSPHCSLRWLLKC